MCINERKQKILQILLIFFEEAYTSNQSKYRNSKEAFRRDSRQKRWKRKTEAQHLKSNGSLQHPCLYTHTFSQPPLTLQTIYVMIVPPLPDPCSLEKWVEGRENDMARSMPIAN
ncbi:hypothetical protein CEXT_6891 [Caerostris extrusa]|uniref:Uncharacterized protein n=1 Tax=Caerostris extrusa TaxID=172846 RepID=A0AAV4ULR5_CAEEX|nr:hypothetical protein CEXT_6891 [Caerostris extrusa]